MAFHHEFRGVSLSKKGNGMFRLWLGPIPKCDAMGHMKAITIRELHTSTGKWVRKAGEMGELLVTERGRVVAKIVPAADFPKKPYFARRKLIRAFREASPHLMGGTDSTLSISDDRERE